MSFLSSVEHFFTGAEADLETVLSSFAPLEADVPGILGLAEIAADGIATADPAIGVPAAAAVTALQATYTTVKAAVASGTGSAATLSQQIVKLGSEALTALQHVLPFVKASANDAATAVTQAKAVAAAVAAAAPVAAPAATA